MMHRTPSEEPARIPGPLESTSGEMTVDVGRFGVWTPLSLWINDGERVAAVAAELEELDYGAIWLGNGSGMFDVASALLDATDRLGVATGVANIKAHPVGPTAAAYSAIAGRHPDRLLLGLGGGWGRVQPTAGQPGATWREKMLEYLDALDASSPPVPAHARVLAANGPKMLAIARERSAGAHSFLVTPEHTRWARGMLGDGPLLVPEQKILLERDPARARTVARRHLAFYLDKPNYTSVLRRLGFAQEDFEGGGSDRLVDALVAWGDVDTVRERIDAHLAAGADHIALQPLTEPADRARAMLPRNAYRRLAEALR